MQARSPEAPLTARCSQSGSELSSRLDALKAEKAELSSEVQRQEADLRAAQGLVREKEAALSREQQRGSRETAELQRRLADKVTPQPPPPPQQVCRALHSPGTSEHLSDSKKKLFTPEAVNPHPIWQRLPASVALDRPDADTARGWGHATGLPPFPEQWCRVHCVSWPSHVPRPERTLCTQL